jgi:aminoglycoside phosphotransferase (APT) family kinase protein
MRNSLILAALASDAVSSIGFRNVKELTNDLGGSIDAALLTGSDGNHYVVRQGATDSAALELATEVAAINVISKLSLPFKVGKVLGETRAPGGRQATVFEFVYGKPVELDRLGAGDSLVESIGSTMASIHNLEPEAIRDAGFPEFTPAETVRQRMNELDRLASTGKIPKTLLDRWSEALENVNLFRFTPTVVHSNLSSVSVLELDGAVSGILAWQGLKVGDPAEDFSWLAGNADQELMDAVRFAYLGTRKVIDPNLSQRAHLYSEMHLGRWLLHGVTLGDESIIAEGAGMLNLLADEVASGDAPALVAGAFARTGGSFIEEAEETEPELFVESKVQPVDDATREIELPEKRDDELF